LQERPKTEMEWCDGWFRRGRLLVRWHCARPVRPRCL